MNKYFTKYLPVTEPITIGDIVLETLINGNKELFEIHTENDIDKETQIKVKLFLCSNDFKIGDKVKIDVLLNNIYNDFLFIEEGSEEGIKYQTFKGVGLYNRYPEFDIEQNVFKIIGEISKEALFYTKENCFFTENEIKIVTLCEECKGTTGIQARCGCNNNEINYVLIKGPCGHFH